MSRAKSIERRDYSHEVRKHRFLWVRLAFAALGTLFLLLGIVGIFMPVLPTTPFLLLATACYVRSSRRFYNWLMNHPALGPLIVEWRTYRSIPWRIKLVAVIAMPLIFGSSIIFFVRDGWLQLALAVFGLTMVAGLYRVPSRDHPGRPKQNGQSGALLRVVRMPGFLDGDVAALIYLTDGQGIGKIAGSVWRGSRAVKGIRL